MNSVLRTHFDMLRFSTEMRVCDSPAKQKQQHNEHGKHRSFSPGKTLWNRDFCGRTKLLPGVLV